MKLQFDPNQTFQLDAIEGVTGLFKGQHQGPPEYAVINLSGDLLNGLVTDIYIISERIWWG